MGGQSQPFEFKVKETTGADMGLEVDKVLPFNKPEDAGEGGFAAGVKVKGKDVVYFFKQFKVTREGEAWKRGDKGYDDEYEAARSEAEKEYKILKALAARLAAQRPRGPYSYPFPYALGDSYPKGDRDRPQPTIMMQCMKGNNLVTLVTNGQLKNESRPGPDIKHVVRIAGNLAEGIGSMHVVENGTEIPLVHRDLSPDNVLADMEDSALPVSIVDFGSAFSANRMSDTTAFTHFAHYEYGAPETFSEDTTDLSNTGHRGLLQDIWSLGAILYFMVTQQYPHAAGMKKLRDAVNNGELRATSLFDEIREVKKQPLRWELPDGFAATPQERRAAKRIGELILHCTRFDPEKRPDIEEVVAELRGIEADLAKPHPKEAERGNATTQTAPSNRNLSRAAHQDVPDEADEADENVFLSICEVVVNIVLVVAILACVGTVLARAQFPLSSNFNDVALTQRMQTTSDSDSGAVWGDWSEESSAQVGEVVQYQVEYVNDRGFFENVSRVLDLLPFGDDWASSSLVAHDVMVRFILPDNMEYIEGSTVLYNSNYPDGLNLENDTATTGGVNIGDYALDGNAYLRIECRVVDNSLQEGENQLVTWANATVNESVVDKDSCSLRVQEDDSQEAVS